MVWRSIENIAALLEDDERQSVLGDIQERGATLRSAIDVTGLVLLRQLQAWKSWRPWALAAALYIPARIAAAQTQPIAQMLSSGVLFKPWELLAAPVLAWAVGFSLGRLGHRRTASLLLLLPLVFTWDIYRIAGYTFERPDMTVTAFPTFAGTARLAILEFGASSIAMLLMLAVVLIPCARGFSRGLSGRPVPRTLALAFAVACLPTIWGMGWSAYQLWSVHQLWRELIVVPVLWPIVYTLTTSRRTRTVYN